MAGGSRRFSDLALALCGLTVVVLWAVRLTASSGASRAEGPLAVLETLEREIGTLSQGENLSITFPVRNAGNRRLVIRQTSACCGDWPPEPVIVAPGESALLEVAVESDRWWGQMRETVDYATNDPALPQFSLCVTGEVKSAN